LEISLVLVGQRLQTPRLFELDRKDRQMATQFLGTAPKGGGGGDGGFAGALNNTLRTVLMFKQEARANALADLKAKQIQTQNEIQEIQRGTLQAQQDALLGPAEQLQTGEALKARDSLAETLSAFGIPQADPTQEVKKVPKGSVQEQGADNVEGQRTQQLTVLQAQLREGIRSKRAQTDATLQATAASRSRQQIEEGQMVQEAFQSGFEQLSKLSSIKDRIAFGRGFIGMLRESGNPQMVTLAGVIERGGDELLKVSVAQKAGKVSAFAEKQAFTDALLRTARTPEERAAVISSMTPEALRALSTPVSEIGEGGVIRQRIPAQEALETFSKVRSRAAGVGKKGKGAVTDAEAIEYIRRAGGDRAKARELARQDGRTF